MGQGSTTTQQQRNNNAITKPTNTVRERYVRVFPVKEFKPHLAVLASSGVIWPHVASSGFIWPLLASSGASDLGGSNFQKNPVVSNKPISLCKVISKMAFWCLGWPRPFLGGSGATRQKRPHVASSGVIWPHLASSGLIWRLLVSSGVIWPHLASSGVIWRHLASLSVFFNRNIIQHQ